MLPCIYKNMCPNCYGDISSDRLKKGLFCENCDPDELKCNTSNLKSFKKFCEADEKIKEFNQFFKSKIGKELSPIQKMWARRYFLDNSFSLLAPTGIGKTTFGLLLSAFVKNAYIIFPTKLLVLQALNRFKEWGIEVLAYTGKKQEKELIQKGDYEILITTTQFLYKNKEIINKKFDLVFVDDVDSVLKSARKIGDIFYLLGFNEGDIQLVLEYIEEKKEYEKIKKIASKKRGNLIVSSATANPKSKRVNLFKYLLGFEISRPNLTLRNIEDLYDNEFSYKKSLEWVKKLGRGGLLFLPGNSTKEEMENYIDFLNKNNIKAYSYEKFNEHIEEFKKGECFFVGFASYKNPLARGIDLPEAIRYTLFVGVPKIEFRLSEDNFKSLYFISLAVFPYLMRKNLLEKKEFFEIQNIINFFKKYVFFAVLHPKVEEKLKNYANIIKKYIKKYENVIKNSNEISFDGEKIVTADITGYIQASGRSSRFYKGHLTKGLALVLVDNQKAFNSLKKKLNWFSSVEFKNVNEVDLKEILKEIDRSREIEEVTEFKTSFIVVESPTKAKTISSFFGNPSRRIINNVIVYEILTQNRLLIITASIGHDFDLVENDGKYGVIDKYIPVFKVLEEKDKILKAMNLSSFEVDEVIVASDPDREGEKIAFDITLNNKPFNLNTKRAEFHEITKYAFKEALNNLREIDKNLVAAQFVRRIADRWIGFEISQYLQKLLNNSHLSAGRVQTPVLKWICERTEKLKEKIFVARVVINGVKVDFELEKNETIGNVFEVKKIKDYKKELFERPFNTSELLKEAAIKLKFSPQKTMQMAQELFEKGLITYHRTDSHRISPLGKSIAKEYIIENFGEEYVKLRSFEEGGAHEAIRATTSMDVEDLRSFNILKNLGLNYNHFRLYDLIFRKFIASQMKEAVVKIELFKIKNENIEKEIEIISQILEDGFNLIFPVQTKNLIEGIYEVEPKIYQKSKYSPYTYADIIDLMKEKGIGRPSTYAITVQKLLERRYVVEKNGFLFATNLGFKVIEILENSEYKEYVSEEFTFRLEEIMDEIEEGKKDYKKELISLYSLLF